MLRGQFPKDGHTAILNKLNCTGDCEVGVGLGMEPNVQLFHGTAGMMRRSKHGS